MERLKQSVQVGRAVRRALVASAALAPMYFMPGAASAQSVPLPVADAGPDQTVVDTDALSGEVVRLDGSRSQASDKESPLLSYTWSNAAGVQIATGPTPTVRLPDGVNQVQLVIVDDLGGSSDGVLTAIDLVNITVRPTSLPTASAGADRTIADTDDQPGELVTLDGTLSSDLDGTLVTYQWLRDGAPIGTGATPSVTLPDGTSQLTLIVTDNVGNTASDIIVFTVGAARPPVASAVLLEAALKPNQRQLATYLDILAPRLADLDAGEDGGLTADQRDLLNRYLGILNDDSSANQRAALDELGAQDINAMRTQALVFSRTQFNDVMERMMALRAGARGVSVAGLNLRIGDQFISGEQVADSLQRVFGGGASADQATADEPGGLLDNALGFWLRGNYGTGKKDATSADDGFESDQWGFTGGMDYRFGLSAVAGLSVGYGQADLDFSPIGQGNVAAKSLTGALYGSVYLGNFYFDGVFNYTDADYESQRHILYNESSVSIDRFARGATAGDALSGGISFGYDFIAGGFTLSPTVGYYLVDTAIDPFDESGAQGLNLAYHEQNYESATGNAGLRISYAWKTSWGVVVPHFRGTYVREFEDETEVFSVRFANDPFASSADPTPPIFVVNDEPDTSYFRLAAGASAQFPYGISGYFEYQRLEAFESIDFQDFTFGLRFQHTFR